MKHAVRRRLQKATALLSLSVFLFAWSVPACAEESTEPEEPTQEVMDEAYDEAMMQMDSEITYLTMEEANYQLALLMKFAAGKLTDEDFAEMKDPDAKRILGLDELIAISDTFIKESETQIDLTEYENAVSSWKEYADVLFDQLPLESRADYLKAAYDVDKAVWDVLKNTLGDILSEVTDLVPDLGARVEEGAEVVSNVFGLIDEFKTILSVGNDNARYEKRIDLQKIKTNFTLLQQMLLIACNTIESVPS